MADRVCVDTGNLMEHDEGMLVGSMGRGLFFVHAETAESPYVASRPFRVNAGAVHAYVRTPDGGTKYLSELQSGDEVQIVDANGRTREAIVGRAKIEKRPMFRVQATPKTATESRRCSRTPRRSRFTLRTAEPPSRTSNRATRSSVTTRTRRRTSASGRREHHRKVADVVGVSQPAVTAGPTHRFQLRRTP